MTGYYFAARYNRNAEIDELAKLLERNDPNASVVSTWHHQDDIEPDYDPNEPRGTELGWKYATRDLEDLDAANVLVLFTAGGGGRGGRHVEWGFFLAKMAWDDVRAVIIGPREHIFHCHPDVEVFPDFDSFLAAEMAR